MGNLCKLKLTQIISKRKSVAEFFQLNNGFRNPSLGGLGTLSSSIMSQAIAEVITRYKRLWEVARSEVHTYHVASTAEVFFPKQTSALCR